MKETEYMETQEWGAAREDETAEKYIEWNRKVKEQENRVTHMERTA